MKVVYQCCERAYIKKRMKALLGDGVVLITGGGNFGDLWPSSEEFRERLVQDFPDNKIIQLPQSIFFNNMGNADKAKKVIEGHNNFILMVRDQPSYEFAQKHFNVRTLLVPDSAFGLGRLLRSTAKKPFVLLLSRNDFYHTKSKPDRIFFLILPGFSPLFTIELRGTVLKMRLKSYQGHALL